MNDASIRKNFHRKMLQRHHSNDRTVVVDELGLRHGRSRADIAVISGRLYGFEIKGESDSLDRLAGQIQSYSAVFDRATVVAAPRHLESLHSMLPRWWGIVVCRVGKRGAIHFDWEREARANENTDPVAVAGLLWRTEAVQILSRLGAEKKLLRQPRQVLYQQLVDQLSLAAVRCEVRQCLRDRENWRDRERPLKYGDSSQRCATL